MTEKRWNCETRVDELLWKRGRINRVLSEVLTDTRGFDRNYLRQDLVLVVAKSSDCSAVVS